RTFTSPASRTSPRGLGPVVMDPLVPGLPRPGRGAQPRGSGEGAPELRLLHRGLREVLLGRPPPLPPRGRGSLAAGPRAGGPLGRAPPAALLDHRRLPARLRGGRAGGRRGGHRNDAPGARRPPGGRDRRRERDSLLFSGRPPPGGRP